MKYKVLKTAIKYKGNKYSPGATIELEVNEAKSLIRSGFIEVLDVQNEDELEDMTVAELKELASDMELELRVTKKADIIEAILEVENEL